MSRSASADRTGLVLFWSGLLGFALGALFVDWQVAVETGQVLAGLVHYPADNPFFIYHVKLWTLLNQLCALGLRLGVSEIALSVILSGLIGMLSIQALSLVVYVLGRDALLAVGAAFVIFVSGASSHGVVYPVTILGTEDTYGVFGLSWAVLAVALLGAGRPKSAGFLLGLAPAVHPSIGVWIGALVGVTALFDRRGAWTAWRPGLRWFFAGGALTALSLAAQFVMMPPLPHVDAAEATRYLVAFVSFWDGHRAPVDFARGGVAINVGALVLSIGWLIRRGAALAGPATFLLRFIAVAAVASLGLAALSHLPPGALPPTLLVLMPSRLLNIDVMIGAALLLGLSAAGSGIVARVVTMGLVVVMPVSRQSGLWDLLEPGGSAVVTALGLPVCAGLVVVGVVLAAAAVSRWEARPEGSPASSGPRRVRAMTAGLMIVAIGLSFLMALERDRAERASILRDRTNERVFGLAAAEPGLLLTGGNLHLMQLRTRRPVLLDGGGLDALPYALEGAPAMSRILQDVYGVDLFHPPEDARGGGEVPLEFSRAVWEGYSVARWQEIAHTYGVTQVIAPGSWHLQLPMIAGGQDLALYRIPR